MALSTLIKVLANNSYSNISLNHELNQSHLSKTEENLATKIVYGTIQYKIYLEYQLKDLIKTRLREKYLKPLLLMSAYQIFFLDRVPNRAVIDEANKLAKEFGKKGSSGFRLVNGILRSLTRRGAILPENSSQAELLSIQESFPVWLVNYFVDQYGFNQTKKMLASFNQTAKNSARISALCDKTALLSALKKQKIDFEISSLNPDCLLFEHGGLPKTSAFNKGKLTIQDEAASLAVKAFDFNGHENLLDACSAPGGKTVQIAEQLTDGSVTALDIHAKKLALVEQNAKRMGVSNRVKTKAIDARKADQYFLKPQFDKILIDAPCSGLGLMRRKPEVRYTKRKSDLLQLQKIQLDILDHVSRLLKSNGQLVYSTCTISKEEDEEVVNEFLKTHPDFELVAFDLKTAVAKSGMLKILPDQYGSDGFFIAKFKLRG